MRVRLVAGRRTPPPGERAFASLREEERGLVHVLDAPEAVVETHRAAIAAGADVIVTETADLVRWRMNARGTGTRWAAGTRAACALAERAREAANPATLIAGAVGPAWRLGPGLVATDALQVEAEQAEQALMLAPFVDLLLCDGIATAFEATLAAPAALATGKPVWVALVPADPLGETLECGTPIARIAHDLSRLGVAAVLLTDCAPATAARAMPALRAAVGEAMVGALPRGADPGADTDAGADPKAFAEAGAQMIAAGAGILGGTEGGASPAVLARLRRLIDAQP